METKDFISDDISVLQPSDAELVLKVGNRDFVLSEIARIVENENARIVNLTTDFQPDDSALISLKINTENLTPILKSLERYSYDIHSYSMNNAMEYDNTDARLYEFLRYLTV